MIQVTKEEASVLRELFPEYTVVRTMKQKSKRHRYYATESEGMMRTIADTNSAAANIVAQIDHKHELEHKRNMKQGASIDGKYY